MRIRTSSFAIVPWIISVGILAAICLAVPGSAPSLAQSGPPNGLPEQASARAEAQFEGELDVIYECDEHTARLKHFLDVGNGRRLRLEFADGVAPDLPTGSRIRVKGHLQNEELMMLTDSGSVQTMSVSAGANTFGQRRVVVMLVNFQDNVSQPYSVTTAQSVLFDQVNRFYQESSYGQTSLTGDVFGWFTLPMNSTTCDTSTIASLADEAARNAGVNLSSYSHKIYAFKLSACSWLGYGSVGGNPSRAWVNGSFAVRTVAHEFGHNLGVYHSRSQPCTAGSCSTSEYGDDRDIMGATVAHPNAFQKSRLGWLNYGTSPPVETISQSGNYWIDAYAPLGTGAKALRVVKSVDSTGARTWYYFEARSKYGFDGGIMPGVVVHTGSDAVGNSSYEIDLDPVTSTFDSTLDANQTFTDSAIGLSVKTLWADASGAMVDVTYSGPPCATGAPTVTFSPSSTVWAQPGKAAGVTVSVKNNDASGCSSAVFTLSSLVPTGWLGTFDRVSLTLDAGATGSANLQLTPPIGTAGQYGFSASASRSAQTTSASGTVVVAEGLAVTLTVGGNARSGYSLSARVLANGQPAIGANVSYAIISPTGSTTWLGSVTNTSGVATVKWRPKKTDPAGSYRVEADATASGLTGTATATIAK
jgi:hypothetical protein